MITGTPAVVRDAQITSSTVAYPDTGETLYDAGTTYGLAATVSYLIGDLYHKFESKQAANTGNTPQVYPDDAANAWWLDLGSVNKTAMFQLDRNTQTIETSSPLMVDVDPGEMVGAIGIGNIIADDVTADVYDSTAALVKTETKSLLERHVTDWYTWTYSTFRQVKNTIFTNLPLNPTHTFKLTFTKSSGDIKVGGVVPFVPFNIGNAQYKAKVRRINFSSFERFFDGEVKITPRRNAPNLDLVLHIKKSKLNGIRAMIDDDLNGIVTAWAVLDDSDDDYFDSGFVIGICKDIEYSLDHPDDLFASIQIEGL